MSEPRDVELVREAANGDRRAYAELVRMHASAVYAVCLAMLHDPDESEDMAQEALIKGMKRIDSLRDGSQFAQWITRIAQNLCRDHWRTKNRRNKLLEEYNHQTAHSAAPAATDLSDALKRLPEKYRLPLLLYYFDGQSSESVARTLNISRAGASTRLARARRELRRILEVDHD